MIGRNVESWAQWTSPDIFLEIQLGWKTDSQRLANKFFPLDLSCLCSKRPKSRPFNNSASQPIVSDQQINRPCIEHKSPADYQREEEENFLGNEIPNWRLFQLNQCVYQILQLWLQGKSYFQIDAALECSRHKSNSKNDVQAICCHYINHAINFRGRNSVQSDLIAWLSYTQRLRQRW